MADSNSQVRELTGTERFAMRLRLCKECDRKDCTKGMFGAPVPQDCPFRVEHIIYEQK